MLGLGPVVGRGRGETNLYMVSSDQGLMGEYRARRSCGALCCHRA